jgi:hypothetical protein
MTLFDMGALLAALSIGWLARGALELVKARRERSAWKRARHFLPSDTSKN